MSATGLAELLGLAEDDPIWTMPLPCERCGLDLRANPELQRPCRNRCCVETVCPGCGCCSGRWGPVGCRCELGGANPLAIDGHAYRRRTRGRKP